MSGLGAWLPGWRHFLSWSGRIGRRTFFGGYVALCFASGALGVVGLGLLSLAGNTDFEAWSVASFVLIGVGLIPLSALFAQRAHDIGLSAFVPLSLFLVLAAPMLTVMDYEPGVFGRALARAAYEAGLDAVTLYPFVIIGNGLWMAFAIFMIVKKGQPNANRFGLPPALTSD